MKDKQTEFRLIQDERSLRELCSRIDGSQTVALDTEFIRERTYYPQLCLVQVASEGAIGAVDCLNDLDLQPLFEALYRKDKSWILHSARQDLEVLFHLTGESPPTLIDTQVAAALLGFPLQIGLKGLVSEILGVAIDKEHTRTDWSRRPLPDAAVDYALDDVRYLLPLRDALMQRLDALGRREWFEEDCESLVNLPIFPEAPAILERTKGAGTLRGKRRAAALALVEWRESRARSKDLPRRWVLPDDQLVAIASRLPESRADLDAIRDLPPKLVTRFGESLLAALRAARPAADDEGQPAAPPDKNAVRAIQTAVKSKAQALGIESEVLATRRDISAAAAGEAPPAFISGWRKDVLADLVSARN